MNYACCCPRRPAASVGIAPGTVEISANIIVHLNTQVRRSTGQPGVRDRAECAGRSYTSATARQSSPQRCARRSTGIRRRSRHLTQRELEQWPAEKWCGVDCVVRSSAPVARRGPALLQPHLLQPRSEECARNQASLPGDCGPHPVPRRATPGLQELAYQEARQAGVPFTATNRQ